MRTFFECIIWTLLIAMMICISTAHAEMRIGVIDTGLNINDPRLSYHICKEGNQDFTGEGLQDDNNHGTHVVGLIEKYAKDSDYCLVILKWYTANQEAPGAYLSALKEAVNLKLDAVNMSLSGKDNLFMEKQLICKHPEIKFIVSSGNEGKDLSIDPRYPASYGCANMVVVGSIGQTSSNFGSIVGAWEDGVGVVSTIPIGYAAMTGTSMACAIYTGKWIYAHTH